MVEPSCPDFLMTLSWLKVRLEVRAEKAGHGELSWEWEGEGEGDEAGGGTEATRQEAALRRRGRRRH